MQSKKITKVQNQGPNDQLISQPGSKLGIDGLVGNVARDPASAGVSPELTILRKKKGQTDLDESEIFSAADLGESVAPYSEQSILVAQLEGAGALGAGTTSGAAVTSAGSSLAAGAAGAGGAAGAVTGASSALAATSAAAATTTTLATATSAMSVGQVAGLSAGVAAAAGGGGGGGGGQADPAPAPLPPANPFPSTDPSADPEAIDLSDSSEGQPVNRMLADGGAFPSMAMNKSLLIDLGINFGPLQSTLYYTEDVGGGAASTRAISFRDISNVTGTAVNDQITGHSGANTLEGGLGDDIIYGDGGLDTLRGGDGSGDWILFKALTRGGGASPYGVEGVDLQLSTVMTIGTSSVTGVYKSSTQTSNNWAEASGFEHAVGSDGGDSIIGSSGNNILDGAGGDDYISGGVGDDHLFGGASTPAGMGNQLLGGAGRDSFWVGYSINPVTRYIDSSLGAQRSTSNSNILNLDTNNVSISTVSNASVIYDWAGGGGAGVNADTLRVSYDAVAVIGGLYGVTLTSTTPNTHWDGNDSVDLSANVFNDGLVKVAAGTGSNQIYLSGGADHVFTGYQYTVAGGRINGSAVIGGAGSEGLGVVTGAIDTLYGWDSVTSPDRLSVGASNTAVIGSLRGKVDSSWVTNWISSDTVDLRQNVSNLGTVIISTGLGNNLVYGTGGVDKIFGSAKSVINSTETVTSTSSYNQVWGGAGIDSFYVGYDYVSGSIVNGTSKDLLWDYANGEILQVRSGSTAVIAQLAGNQSWANSDTVDLSTITLITGATPGGTQSMNQGVIVITTGDSDDIIIGSAGVDHIYAGRSHTAAGNLISGGLGNDHFFVGFNYDPLAGATNDASGRTELGPSDNAVDVIRDWQDSDSLTVGSRGQAIIGGLYGFTNASTGWDPSSSINLSATVVNSGLIRVAAGAGNNQITASTGVDYFYVGSQYSGTSTLSSSNGAATDLIWGWDDQSLVRDDLTVAVGSTAVIGALRNQTHWQNQTRSTANSLVDWTNNDTVDLRSQVSNSGLIQVAAGAGNNTIYGSSGSDHYHVGYVNNSNGTTAVSAVAVDTLHGWDARLWSNVAFAGTWDSGANWNGSADSDDSTYDRLTLAAGSTLRIGSLLVQSATNASRWDGSDTVDLRSSVSNNNTIAAHGGAIEIWTGPESDYIFGSSGRDLIYSGPGLDNVWGGAGNDVFYVGFSPSWAPSGSDAAEPSIWDWQNTDGSSAGVGTAALPGDGLRIAEGSFTRIQGLWGMDSSSSVTKQTRWAGANTVDLRWDVLNSGKIVLETMGGDDVVYGSSGVDYINPGSGRNTLVLDNGGADRIYLDNFMTETMVSGFGSDDRLYLDTRVLETFAAVKGVVTLPNYSLNQNIFVTSDDRVASGSMTDGQQDRPGSLFPLSKVVFNSVYNGELSGYGADARDPDGVPQYGWTSNGAYNNNVYQSIWPLAVTGVSTTANGFFALGNGLSMIPIVGPLLAIAPWTIAGLMWADAGMSKPYLNPEYRGVDLITGASLLSYDKPVYSDVGSWSGAAGVSQFTGTWDSQAFLNFYNVVNSTREYAPSLEFKDHQGAVLGQVYGVSSYLAVHSDDETFVYLVTSRDGLIQNNETRLIAQVNGLLSANQIVMYNGGADTEYLRYFNNTVATPVFAAQPSFPATGVTVVDGGKQALYGIAYTSKAGITTTAGTSGTPEAAAVTFNALLIGQKISIAGLTFTATVARNAGEVADAFAGLSAGATTGASTSFGSYEGTLTGWSTSAKTSASVTFTSAVNGDIANLEISKVYDYVTSTQYTSLAAHTAGLERLSVQSVATNDSLVNVTIAFNNSNPSGTVHGLLAGDVVRVYSGITLIGHYEYKVVGTNPVALIKVTGLDATYDATARTISLLRVPVAEGDNSLRVVLQNAQEFEAEASNNIARDTTAPDSTYVKLSSGESTLSVSSDGPGSAVLRNSVTPFTTITSTSLTDSRTGGSREGVLAVSAQTSQTLAEVVVSDVMGNSRLMTDSRILLGTDSADTIGTSGSPQTAQSVYGFNGADIIYVNAAGVTVYGGADNDSIYMMGSGGATLYGGSGNDTLSGGSGADTLVGGVGADTMTSGSGNDRFYFSAGDSNAVAGTAPVAGSPGVPGVFSRGQDAINDWASGDLIVISGSVSNDFSVAADVRVGTGTDLALASTSVASVGDFSTSTYLVDLDRVTTTHELAVVVTSNGTARAFADVDAAHAATAIEISVSGSVGRSITGGANADVIYGGSGADTLFGEDGNDRLTGGAGADTIYGGNGADTITGGAGADILWGEGGSDVFSFLPGDSIATSFDTVSDVGLVGATAGRDTIDILGSETIATAGVVDGVNFGSVIKSHSVSATGLISFDDVDSYSAALLATEFTVTDAVGYLQANITEEGNMVAFKYGNDAYLFKNSESGDVFIKFAGIDGTPLPLMGLTKDSGFTTADYLYVI